MASVPRDDGVGGRESATFQLQFDNFLNTEEAEEEPIPILDSDPSPSKKIKIRKSGISIPPQTNLKTPIYANSHSHNLLVISGLVAPKDLEDPYRLPETNNNASFEFFKEVHVWSNAKSHAFNRGLDCQTIWTKFFAFSRRQATTHRFNPYEASDEELADLQQT